MAAENSEKEKKQQSPMSTGSKIVGFVILAPVVSVIAVAVYVMCIKAILYLLGWI